MPVADGGNLALDPGILFVSLCLQRGDFAEHSTVQSVICGKEEHLTFKEDRLEKPFFQAGTPGGWSLDPDAALDANGYRRTMVKVCVQGGFGGEYLSATCTSILTQKHYQVPKNTILQPASVVVMPRS